MRCVCSGCTKLMCQCAARVFCCDTHVQTGKPSAACNQRINFITISILHFVSFLPFFLHGEDQNQGSHCNGLKGSLAPKHCVWPVIVLFHCGIAYHFPPIPINSMNFSQSLKEIYSGCSPKIEVRNQFLSTRKTFFLIVIHSLVSVFALLLLCILSPRCIPTCLAISRLLGVQINLSLLASKEVKNSSIVYVHTLFVTRVLLSLIRRHYTCTDNVSEIFSSIQSLSEYQSHFKGSSASFVVMQNKHFRNTLFRR